ncbi:hypothetical protein EVAR_77979_1 [Eumeta japonica]|uniref:Uncharacterized protein n=1 Tax=Eumeta variegata TaxID=151549 RepID=A0A4C1T2V0_EUMVA|nr:hypothetical protein EVAR_77979_1 [Eumeta japonica]
MLLSKVLLFTVALAVHECTASDGERPWDRDVDQKLNEVVLSSQKSDDDGKRPLSNPAVGPVSVGDVKCLLSDTRYLCSERMSRIKGILIKVVENNCRRCTAEEKREAGVAILSLLVHERAALRQFLIKHKGFKKLQELGS